MTKQELTTRRIRLQLTVDKQFILENDDAVMYPAYELNLKKIMIREMVAYLENTPLEDIRWTVEDKKVTEAQDD